MSLKKFNLLRALVPLALYLPFVGCATAVVTTYTRDARFEKARYASVAVEYSISDLPARPLLETEAVQRLLKSGVAAYSVSNLTGSNENVPREKLLKVLRKQRVRALLVISFPRWRGRSLEYDPDTGGSAADVSVYDVRTGLKAWTGTVTTSGSDFGAVREELVTFVCDYLVKDNLFVAATKKQRARALASIPLAK